MKLGNTRSYVDLLIAGTFCLVGAIVLYASVVEFRAVVPTSNLRPLFMVMIWIGVAFPLVAVLARPRKFFLASVLYLLILCLLPKSDDGVRFGTMSNTWDSTSYGWPASFLHVHYHKGGDWSESPFRRREWITYEERTLGITWWKILPSMGLSLAGAFVLMLPSRLMAMRKANRAAGSD